MRGYVLRSPHERLFYRLPAHRSPMTVGKPEATVFQSYEAAAEAAKPLGAIVVSAASPQLEFPFGASCTLPEEHNLHAGRFAARLTETSV